MRWIVVLLLVAVLAACGGDDDSGNENAGAGNADPAPTPASQSDDDGGAVSGSTSVTFSGAESGEITDTGSCSGGVSGDGLQLFTSYYDADEDVTWMLQLSISEYDGPGQYEVGNSLVAGESVTFDDTNVSLSNNAGGQWGSTRDLGGSVSVNADEISGSVDAMLTTEDDSSEILVSGVWTCTR